MAEIFLYLLGSPRLERAGQSISVDTRKAIALLAYLAVHEGYQSRDTLAALLWAESDHSSARGALRRTLSALNSALEGKGLVIEREAIALNPAEITCDLIQFRAAIEASQQSNEPKKALLEALSLYKGDFLQGFSLRDSAEFDTWQFQQSEYCQRLYRLALEKILKLERDIGQYDAAIGYAQRYLALDPLHEPAQRQLIQLYAWSGQRAAALKQYQSCVRILEQELGVAPLEETTELYTLLLENRLQAMPMASSNGSSPASQSKPKSSQLPLIGRENLLQQMKSIYQTYQESGLIALEGETGIGKTRLAQALFDSFPDAPSISMICYENEMAVAYAPLIRCLREALQRPQWLEAMPEHWLSDLARLLPELSLIRNIQVAAGEAIGAQIRLYEALSTAFSQILKADKTALLLIENLQWIDHASLDFLSYLLNQAAKHRCLLLLTWRTEDIPRSHRLRLMLHDFERDTGKVLSLSLKRLPFEAIAELVNELELPHELAALLYRESEGLPFFLAEYLRFYKDSAMIQRETPQGIQDLLHSRLAGLGAMAQQLLGTAAVIGRSFDHDLLREASGRSEEEVLEGVEELLRRAMIHETQGASYEFYHEKLRELVYQDMSMARRRLLHKRLAQTVLGLVRQSHKFPQVAAQIAYHFQASGQETEAAIYYFEAGLYARSVFANHEALSHFQAALALAHPEIVEIYQQMGDLQTLMGDYLAAIHSYETALAHAQMEHQAHCEQRLANVYQRLGEWEISEAYYQAAYEKFAASSSLEQCSLLVDWCLKNLHQKQFDKAQKLITMALTIAQQSKDTYAQAQVYNVMGILARKAAMLPDALNHLEQSLKLTIRLKAVGMQVAVHNNLALTLSSAGRAEEALEHLNHALELCTQQGDLHHAAALHNNLADVYHALKQPNRAIEELKQAVALFSQIGLKGEQLHPEIWNLAEW